MGRLCEYFVVCGLDENLEVLDADEPDEYEDIVDIRLARPQDKLLPGYTLIDKTTDDVRANLEYSRISNLLGPRKEGGIFLCVKRRSGISDDRAIADVRVFQVPRGSKDPEGWTLIRQTVGEQDANLGSLTRPVYLGICYSRNVSSYRSGGLRGSEFVFFEQPVIKDIKIVLLPNPPPRRQPDQTQFNASSSNDMPDNQAPNIVPPDRWMGALQSFVQEYNTNVPIGYIVIDTPLASQAVSMMGSSIGLKFYMTLRKSKPRGICDVRLQASVMDRYPLLDHEDFALPAGSLLPMFSFPLGIKLFRSSIQNAPLAQYFPYVLTDANGSKIYVACLMFHEPVPDNIQLKILSKSWKQSEDDCRFAFAASVGADRHAHSDKSSSSMVFSPKCICLLSRFPFFQSFRSWLSQLYTISLSRSDRPLERWISNLLYQCPFPTAGGSIVKMVMDERFTPIRFSIPPILGLPIVDINFDRLFSSLDVDNILQIFTYLLLERKVVVHSRYATLVTEVCESLRCLLFPLEWESCYIPRMNEALMSCLEFPGGILVGVIEGEEILQAISKENLKCDTSDLQDTLLWKVLQNLPRDVLLVDVDNNNLTYPNEVTARQPTVPTSQANPFSIAANALSGNPPPPSSVAKDAFNPSIPSSSPLTSMPRKSVEWLRERLSSILKQYQVSLGTVQIAHSDSAFDMAPIPMEEEKMPKQVLDKEESTSEQSPDGYMANDKGQQGQNQPASSYLSWRQFPLSQWNPNDKRCLIPIYAIRDAFLTFMATVLMMYSNFLIQPKPNWQRDTSEWIDSKGFEASFGDGPSQVFYSEFLKSQMFASFIQRRTEKSDPQMLFFDYCVAILCDKPFRDSLDSHPRSISPAYSLLGRYVVGLKTARRIGCHPIEPVAKTGTKSAGTTTTSSGAAFNDAASSAASLSVKTRLFDAYSAVSSLSECEREEEDGPPTFDAPSASFIGLSQILKLQSRPDAVITPLDLMVVSNDDRMHEFSYTSSSGVLNWPKLNTMLFTNQFILRSAKLLQSHEENLPVMDKIMQSRSRIVHSRIAHPIIQLSSIGHGNVGPFCVILNRDDRERLLSLSRVIGCIASDLSPADKTGTGMSQTKSKGLGRNAIILMTGSRYPLNLIISGIEDASLPAPQVMPIVPSNRTSMGSSQAKTTITVTTKVASNDGPSYSLNPQRKSPMKDPLTRNQSTQALVTQSDPSPDLLSASSVTFSPAWQAKAVAADVFGMWFYALPFLVYQSKRPEIHIVRALGALSLMRRVLGIVPDESCFRSLFLAVSIASEFALSDCAQIKDGLPEADHAKRFANNYVQRRLSQLSVSNVQGVYNIAKIRHSELYQVYGTSSSDIVFLSNELNSSSLSQNATTYGQYTKSILKGVMPRRPYTLARTFMMAEKSLNLSESADKASSGTDVDSREKSDFSKSDVVAAALRFSVDLDMPDFPTMHQDGFDWFVDIHEPFSYMDSSSAILESLGIMWRSATMGCQSTDLVPTNWIDVEPSSQAKSQVFHDSSSRGSVVGFASAVEATTSPTSKIGLDMSQPVRIGEGRLDPILDSLISQDARVFKHDKVPTSRFQCLLSAVMRECQRSSAIQSVVEILSQTETRQMAMDDEAFRNMDDPFRSPFDDDSSIECNSNFEKVAMESSVLGNRCAPVVVSWSIPANRILSDDVRGKKLKAADDDDNNLVYSLEQDNSDDDSDEDDCDVDEIKTDIDNEDHQVKHAEVENNIDPIVIAMWSSGHKCSLSEEDIMSMWKWDSLDDMRVLCPFCGTIFLPRLNFKLFPVMAKKQQEQSPVPPANDIVADKEIDETAKNPDTEPGQARTASNSGGLSKNNVCLADCLLERRKSFIFGLATGPMANSTSAPSVATKSAFPSMRTVVSYALPSDIATRLPRDTSDETGFMTVASSGLSMRSLNDDSSELGGEKQIPLSNPSILRQLLEVAVRKHGRGVLCRERMKSLEPELFWCLWWYFSRFGLPLPFSSVQTETRKRKSKSANKSDKSSSCPPPWVLVCARDQQTALRGANSAIKYIREEKVRMKSLCRTVNDDNIAAATASLRTPSKKDEEYRVIAVDVLGTYLPTQRTAELASCILSSNMIPFSVMGVPCLTQFAWQESISMAWDVLDSPLSEICRNYVQNPLEINETIRMFISKRHSSSSTVENRIVNESVLRILQLLAARHSVAICHNIVCNSTLLNLRSCDLTSFTIVPPSKLIAPSHSRHGVNAMSSDSKFNDKSKQNIIQHYVQSPFEPLFDVSLTYATHNLTGDEKGFLTPQDLYGDKLKGSSAYRNVFGHLI